MQQSSGFKSKVETLDGEIINTDPIRPKETKTGKTFAEFDFRCKDGRRLLTCKIWEEELAMYGSQIIPGAKLIIRGFMDSWGNFSVRRVLPLGTRRTSRERIVQEWGTYEKYLADQKDRIELEASRGRVPTWVDGDTLAFFPKADVVQVNGRWIRKIEFCMDILGGEEVTKRTKAAGFSWKDVVGEGKKFDPAKYREFVNTLTEEARNQLTAKNKVDSWDDGDEWDIEPD